MEVAESAAGLLIYKELDYSCIHGGKNKNMEVAESAAGLLIYKELDYSCIHGGKNLVPFPKVNAQTQGQITYIIP